MAELQLTQITKSYPTRTGNLSILTDINMSLNRGESISIVGPSGSGKSTLLHILGTLDRPTSGSYELFGESPFLLSESLLSAYRNSTIGFVFQDHFLLPQLSVLENCLVPALARGSLPPGLLDRGRLLLENFGLTSRLEHLPSELSGGERQRAAIARALLMSPRLLLADEPTGNLDRRTAESVAQILLDLPQKENAILVIVTHSESLAGRTKFRRRIVDGRLEEA
jgi:lipoprotein-releasing system ATP-binding protein